MVHQTCAIKPIKLKLSKRQNDHIDAIMAPFWEPLSLERFSCIVYKAEPMNSFNEAIKADKPVLVDFFATWCGPCKMMAPILQDVKATMGDKVTIIKVDVDKNTEVSAHYQVQGVPTLMLFRKGELKWRQSGVMQSKQIQEIVTKFGSM